MDIAQTLITTYTLRACAKTEYNEFRGIRRKRDLGLYNDFANQICKGKISPRACVAYSHVFVRQSGRFTCIYTTRD